MTAYQYAEKKHPASAPQKAESVPAVPALDALKAGAVQPAAEQLGRPVDLPGAIRAKMEASFGADLSAVKLYESQAVADAGAEAVAQGSRIAFFAPGALDFSSSSGQALLGHELSHVVSQARGEVSGSGFLNDTALEARADREGAMAAAGEQVYTGPVTAALSSASVAPAAGPMQASKAEKTGGKHYLGLEKHMDQFYNNAALSPDEKEEHLRKAASHEKWMRFWARWLNPDAILGDASKAFAKMQEFPEGTFSQKRQTAMTARYRFLSGAWNYLSGGSNTILYDTSLLKQHRKRHRQKKYELGWDPLDSWDRVSFKNDDD